MSPPNAQRTEAIRRVLALVCLVLLAACGAEKPVTKPTPTVLRADRVIPQLRRQVETQTAKSVGSIDCPALPLPWAAGTSFHCQVTFTDGSTLALFVSQADDQGHVHYVEAG
jgi:hypothetical protein